MTYNPSEHRDSHGRWSRSGSNDLPTGAPSYTEVAKDYEWPKMQKEGTYGTPAEIAAMQQQGKAQIRAEIWDETVTGDSPPEEQYATSIWEAYQSPTLYTAINTALRTGKQDPANPSNVSPEEMKKYVGVAFDRGGYTLDQDTTFFRALKTAPGPINWAETLKPGSTFTDKGIVSTTAETRFAQGWLTLKPHDDATSGDFRAPEPDDVVMEIKAPKGTRIMGGKPQFIETMLKPGTKFKIVSSEKRQAAKPTSPLDQTTKPKPFTYTHVVAEVVS